MPDDGRADLTPARGAESEGRFDREPLIAFIADTGMEDALREGLADATPDGLDIRRGGIRAAIAAFRKIPTPQVLIVDIGGEERPLSALRDLAEVVEPDVRVLVVGDGKDVDFYRVVTRGLGVAEYLPKPINRESVARHFAPLLGGEHRNEALVAGRVVTVTGARGGVGATTIAVNLAWHFAADARRHTLLLDPDLYCGTAALMLDVKAGPGLRTALENPARIDPLFVERAARPAVAPDLGNRLHVLAGEEKLETALTCAPDAAPLLLDELRRRYGLVIADVPFAPDNLHRGLLEHAHQRIVVIEPSLASIRDALRLLALPRGTLQTRRPLLVLNRNGRPGGLSRKEVENALDTPLDVVIPDLPRPLGQASTMGEPAVQKRGAFRNAILELARLAAFVPLLDSAIGASEGESARRRTLRDWMRR